MAFGGTVILRWYGGSKVVLWFFVVRWFLFHFPWLAWFLCLSILYSSCLRQWVSVWEGRGSKNWLVLDLVYFLVVLLLRLT